jgi:hypothetical protein
LDAIVDVVAIKCEDVMRNEDGEKMMLVVVVALVVWKHRETPLDVHGGEAEKREVGCEGMSEEEAETDRD